MHGENVPFLAVPEIVKKNSKMLEFYPMTLYYYNRQKLDLLNDSLSFS